MGKQPLKGIGIFCVILILSLSAGGEFTNGSLSDEMKNVLQADKQLSLKMESGGCEALLEHLANESWILPRDGHLIKGRKKFQKILDKAEERKLRCIRNWDSPITSPAEVRSVEKNLMDVDRAFSKLSIQKGYLEAFYSYIADDGITVSSGGPPANKKTYRKRMEALKAQTNPPEVQLVWEPVLGYVASSDDLGFTSGPFTLTVTDPSGRKSEQRGYYLSIWGRQSDGTWKFIFDGGNQVLE